MAARGFMARRNSGAEEDLLPVGKSYTARVPDTLDLAGRARIAVGGLTNFLDHRREYSTFGHGFLCTRPPYMVHDNGQSQNWGKVLEALILARQMCGSSE